MDIGFSRRHRPNSATPLNRLDYASLLAELAESQAQSVTARAQSQIGTAEIASKSPEMSSFNAATAALLSETKE